MQIYRGLGWIYVKMIYKSMQLARWATYLQANTSSPEKGQVHLKLDWGDSKEVDQGEDEVG